MDSKIRDLVKAATEKSLREKLKWHAIDTEAFRTQLGTGRLVILRTIAEMTSGNVYRYVVSITDQTGREVAEAYAVEGVDSDSDVDELQKLFEASRTAAFGGHQLIDTMLKELETIP